MRLSSIFSSLLIVIMMSGCGQVVIVSIRIRLPKWG